MASGLVNFDTFPMKLRFLILAVIRLAVGVWRAFVRRVAARRTGMLVHMRIAARFALRRIGVLQDGMLDMRIATRLTLRHRPRFSRLPYVVRGRRVRP